MTYRTYPLFVAVAETLWVVKNKQPHLGFVLIKGMFGLVQGTEKKWDFQWQGLKALSKHYLEMGWLSTGSNRFGK